MNNEAIEDLDYNEQLAAATNRLFEILRTEESVLEFCDEVLSLLQRFPKAAGRVSFQGGIYQNLLHMACRNNAPISVICALLTAWPDGVRNTPIGRSYLPLIDAYLPLIDACICAKSLPTIQLLVEAYPESVQEKGRTTKLPLQHALDNADVSCEIIEYLVRQWPQSVDYGDRRAVSALHQACSSGLSLSIIQFLYQQAPHFIQRRTKDGDLPLHLACRQSRTSIDTIAFLLNAWPESIRERDCRSSTPLFLACTHHVQNIEMISLLLNKYPDAVQTAGQIAGQTGDYRHRTLPLHQVCKFSAPLAVIQMFVTACPQTVRSQDYAKNIPLNYLCMSSMSAMGTHCLNVQPLDGMLPLHCACETPIASADVISYLIESYPVAVRVPDCHWRLPLHIACNQATALPMETIECLVRAWPDSIQVCFNTRSDFNKGLPLDLACASKCQPSVELICLLTNRTPPLHFACTQTCTSWIPDRMATLKILITKFSKDGMVFHDGKLPIHCACYAQAPQAVLKWWLEQYTDSIHTVTTDSGDSPLHCYLSSRAISVFSHTVEDNSDYFSAVQYLVAQQPSALYHPNKMGFLPLHLAAMHDDSLDVVFYLARQNPSVI